MKRLVQAIAILWAEAWAWLMLSSTFSTDKKKNSERKIKLLIHSIEKGLCLKEVKVGFGKAKITELVKYISIYESIQGKEDYLVVQAKYAVNEYINFHKKSNYDVSSYVKPYDIEDRLIKAYEMPGVAERHSYADNKLKGLNYEELVTLRHSTRTFSDKDIDYNKLREAIELARVSAPSACNRQSVKVYCIKEKEALRKVLSIQGGNRGFGESAKAVLVVTADLKMYAGVEKKLPLVDGGVFINALANSLFYKGIANCILHGSLTGGKEKNVKKICGIKSHEMVVAFIALGAYEKDYMVAVSPRKPLSETYTEV